MIGILFSTILATGFRRNERWAWWAMWLLPIWGAAVSATILRQGVVEGQAPPSPLFTGPLIAALSSALLLITVPRFVTASRRFMRPLKVPVPQAMMLTR